MSSVWPKFRAVAEHGVLVEFGDEFSEAVHREVLALYHAVDADVPSGVRELVPALVNLFVEFDPLVTDHQEVSAAVSSRLSRKMGISSPPTLREVEVCYDAEFAPDLEAVAVAKGLSQEAVISAHLSSECEVRMYGFAPGYAYLTGIPAAIQVPRKDAAVRDIPAGSVLIAGPQCLVTTLKMPTGWSIIGRSPTRILTEDSDRPFLFDVGDRVVFKRIGRQRFDEIVRHG